MTAMIAAVDAYVGACACMEFVAEVPPGSNAGPVVERIQRAGGGTKGDAWCADAVCDVGVRVFGKGWPLPRTGSCNALAIFAIDHGIFRCTEAVRADLATHGLWDITTSPPHQVRAAALFGDAAKLLQVPARGDVCLLYDAATHHFHHAEVLDEIIDGTFTTWAGNTIPTGATGNQREGWGYFGKRHALSQSWAFVRWVDLYAGAAA